MVFKLKSKQAEPEQAPAPSKEEQLKAAKEKLADVEKELEQEKAEEATEETEEITGEKIVGSLVQHEQRLQAIESALLRIRGAI